MQKNKQHHLTTSEAARMLGVQGATIRRGLCVNGHYMNVRPIKLPNNRLLWPVAEVEQILKPEDLFGRAKR